MNVIATFYPDNFEGLELSYLIGRLQIYGKVEGTTIRVEEDIEGKLVMHIVVPSSRLRELRREYEETQERLAELELEIATEESK